MKDASASRRRWCQALKMARNLISAAETTWTADAGPFGEVLAWELARQHRGVAQQIPGLMRITMPADIDPAAVAEVLLTGHQTSTTFTKIGNSALVDHSGWGHWTNLDSPSQRATSSERHRDA